MTTPSPSGETTKATRPERTISSENWTGHEVSVVGEPLRDSGSGQTIVIRSFIFSANPDSLKRDKPSKQQLFDAHAQEIKLFLWKDGLQPYAKLSPKIIVSKKGERYAILVHAQARPGVTFTDSTQLLQDIMNTNGK